MLYDSDSDAYEYYVDDIIINHRRVNHQLKLEPTHDYCSDNDTLDSIISNDSDSDDDGIGKCDIVKSNYQNDKLVLTLKASNDIKDTNKSNDNLDKLLFNNHIPPFMNVFNTQKELESESEYNNIILDSGANITAITNTSLLTEVKELEQKYVISHFGGKSTVTHGGDHPILGKVIVRPDLKTNIVPLCALEDAGYDEFTSKDKMRKVFTNPKTKHTIVFEKGANKMYKCHIGAFQESLKQLLHYQIVDYYKGYNVYMNITMNYTMEQQRRAKFAIDLHNALDHPSDKALSALLISPSSINVDITPQDLINARAIYGPCSHCLEGKPVPHKGSHSSNDPNEESQAPGEIVHVDVIFVIKRPYMFAVDDNTNYMLICEMASKSTNEVIKALDDIIAKFRSHLKVVKIISSDSEYVLTSKEVEQHLGNQYIKQVQSIPGEHSVIVERQARILREKMESKLSELPFHLPKDLYLYLILDIIRKCNVVPNAKTVPRSPMEMVEGKKFNPLTDIQANFGQAVVVTNAKPTQNSNATNQIGICLGEAYRVRGAIMVLCPGDDRNIPKPRRAVAGTIMTQDKIDWMNDLAKQKPIPIGEPIIQFKEIMEYSENGNPNININDRIINDNNQITGTIDTSNVIDDNIVTDVSTDNDIPSYIDTSTITSNHNHEKLPEITEPPIVPQSSTTDTNTVKKSKNKAEVTSEPRRSARQADPSYKNKAVITKSGVNLTELHAYVTAIENVEEPYYSVFASDAQTWNEALKSAHAAEAKAAAKKELKGLMDMKSWRYLNNINERSASSHTTITRPMMLIKVKRDAKGQYLSTKGRFVAGGHTCDPNIYNPLETHSPTVPLEVAMIQLGIASYSKAEVEAIDIPVAYLNAFLKDDKRQVMRIPKHLATIMCDIDPKVKDYLQSDGSLLVEVLRALYGFPESARLWNDVLTNALINGGYKQCNVEPCLFRKYVDTNHFSIVSVYVDDCLHIYKGNNMREGLHTAIRKAGLPNPTCQALSINHDISYLGVNISKEGSTLYISQPGYTQDIIDSYPPDRIYKTPCTEDLFNRPITELNSPLVNVTLFLSLLMKLMFLATRTRPDILTSVCGLATKCRAPNEADQQRTNRIVGYLAGTKDARIKIKVDDLDLHAYFDASFAVYPDMKGVDGLLITFGHFGFPIIFKSSKQKPVFRNSTESELGCLYKGVDLLLYIRRLCLFLQVIDTDYTIPVYQDNTSTIKMAYMGRGSSHSNNKFIEIKYFWIKDHLDNKRILLRYLSTEEMPADLFASPRIGGAFYRRRNIIMCNDIGK